MIKEVFTKSGDTWTLHRRSEKYALYKRVGECGRHWDIIGITKRLKDHLMPSGIKIPAGTESLNIADRYYGYSSWCFNSPMQAENKWDTLVHNHEKQDPHS